MTTVTPEQFLLEENQRLRTEQNHLRALLIEAQHYLNPINSRREQELDQHIEAALTQRIRTE